VPDAASLAAELVEEQHPFFVILLSGILPQHNAS
jgi:hypothetical protein